MTAAIERKAPDYCIDINQSNPNKEATMTMVSEPRSSGVRSGTVILIAALVIWAGAVAALAERGVFRALPLPLIALLVAAGIALPTLIYLTSSPVRRYFDAIGLFPLTVLHIWRIPAALAFFGYGLACHLPTAFWMLAGVGDLIAGLLAARLAARAPDIRDYWRFHLFGFGDFVVAVGTGLTFTLLGDPRMATVASLPMALIPLFGVGVSGTSHLIAFDLLRRAGTRA
jgi:hypothetical protein